jgi:hypothetical protein
LVIERLIIELVLHEIGILSDEHKNAHSRSLLPGTAMEIGFVYTDMAVI